MSKVIRSDFMRGSLALALVLAFQVAMGALFWHPIPQSNEQLLTYMLGQLSGMVTTALAFYFATTQGSEQKTHMLAERQPLNGHHDEHDIPSPQFGKEP